jgi:hypothetical protein
MTLDCQVLVVAFPCHIARATRYSIRYSPPFSVRHGRKKPLTAPKHRMARMWFLRQMGAAAEGPQSAGVCVAFADRGLSLLDPRNYG